MTLKVEAFHLGRREVVFSDGAVGRIETFFGEGGEASTELIENPVVVVVKHPTLEIGSWITVDIRDKVPVIFN